MTSLGIAQIKEVIARSHWIKNPLVVLAWRVSVGMGRNDAVDLAAGIAYYSLFCLFPLLLGFLSIMGLALNSEEVQQRFLDLIAANLPGSANFVRSNVNEIVRLRGALGIGAILGLLWLGTAVFGCISRAINRAWGLRQDRPFYLAKPLHLVMAFTVGVLFLLSAMASSVIQLVMEGDLSVPGQEFFLGLGLGRLALLIVPWLITLSIFLLIYRFVPNCKTYWRYIWPGAVVAALLFELAKGLFVWYLREFAIYTQIYGSLASVIVLLFWAYLSALILMLGAEISYEYGRLRLPPPEDRRSPLDE